MFACCGRPAAASLGDPFTYMVSTMRVKGSPKSARWGPASRRRPLVRQAPGFSIDLVLQLQGPFASVVIGSIEHGDVLESARVVRNLTDTIEEIAHVQSCLGTVLEEAVAGGRAGRVPGWVQSPMGDTLRVSEIGLRAIGQRIAGPVARIAHPA